MEPLGHSITAEPRTGTTTVLIRNLHCSSCISNIEDSLLALSPKPTSVSSSIIVSQSVTVQHEISLPVSNILHALEEAGFDIDSIVQDPARATEPLDNWTNDTSHNTQRHSPAQLVKRWS